MFVTVSGICGASFIHLPETEKRGRKWQYEDKEGEGMEEVIILSNPKS